MPSKLLGPHEQGLIAKKPTITDVFHPIDDWTWTGAEGF